MKYQDKNTFRIALMCFAIFFLVLTCASTAHAGYSLAGTWDSVQLSGVTNLAVDSSGNVFVADYGNGCIDKFNSNGNLNSTDQWTFQPSGPQQVTQTGIGVDSSGNVYVITGSTFVDSSGKQIPAAIAKYAPDHSLVGTWGKFSVLTSLAVDSSGNCYVADYLSCDIYKYDSYGNLITQWTFQPVGGQEACQSGIGVDSSGNVSVMTGTPGQPVINKFTTNGSPLPFPASVQFSGLTNLAVDSSGNVFVADYGNACIDKFDSNGNLIDSWTFQTFHGGEVGQSGIGVDPSGNIYVITGSAVGYSSGSGVKSSGNVSVKKGIVGGHSSGSGVKSYDNVSVVKGTPGQGVIEKYTLGNIFYPGINWQQQDDPFYNGIENELNPQNGVRINSQLTKMMNSYLGTDMFSGAFQVFLASTLGHPIPIETETNFLSDYSDKGEYNIAFAHSGGTRTLVDKIESGTIKANYVVLAAPALITQEELEFLTAAQLYGVKKVIVFQSPIDTLNMLHVRLVRNFDGSHSAMGFDHWNLPHENPNEPEPQTIGTRFRYSYLDINPYILQAHLNRNVIPEDMIFWVGGADRNTASLFKNSDSVVTVNFPGIGEYSSDMHRELGQKMAEYYANSDDPFDGFRIPGLKGLK